MKAPTFKNQDSIVWLQKNDSSQKHQMYQGSDKALLSYSDPYKFNDLQNTLSHSMQNL
jgi:hypothetical protein